MEYFSTFQKIIKSMIQWNFDAFFCGNIDQSSVHAIKVAFVRCKNTSNKSSPRGVTSQKFEKFCL